MAARVTGEDEGTQESVGFGPTEHDINLPPFNVGNLVLCFITWNATAVWPGTPPSGWTTLLGADDWNVPAWIGGRHITGTEGYVGDGTDVVTYDLDDVDSAHITLTIAGNDTADEAPQAVGEDSFNLLNNQYPDPPNVSFNNGGEHLVIAVAMTQGIAGISNYPSNYDDDQYEVTILHDFTYQLVAVATRTVTGTSENPGVLTLPSSTSHRAATIVVPSLPSGGGGFGALGL